MGVMADSQDVQGHTLEHFNLSLSSSVSTPTRVRVESAHLRHSAQLKLCLALSLSFLLCFIGILNLLASADLSRIGDDGPWFEPFARGLVGEFILVLGGLWPL